jgi:hypothetical protein
MTCKLCLFRLYCGKLWLIVGESGAPVVRRSVVYTRYRTYVLRVLRT